MEFNEGLATWLDQLKIGKLFLQVAIKMCEHLASRFLLLYNLVLL